MPSANWQITYFSAINIFTAILSVFVARIVWQRYKQPGATPIFGLLLAITVWAFCQGMEDIFLDQSTRVLWAKLSYLGITSSTPLFFLLACEFTWQKKLNTLWKILLWTIPVLSCLMAFTNDWHFLLWSSYSWRSNVLVYGHGPWFWVNIAYSYILLTLSSAILLFSAIRNRHIYKRQSMALIIGTPLPALSNIAYVFGFSMNRDFTPVAFAMTSSILIWGFFKLRLFDLVPITRDAIIETLQDGLIVIDENLYVVDINHSARKILDNPGKNLIGMPLKEVSHHYPQIADQIIQALAQNISNLVIEKEERFFDIHITSLDYFEQYLKNHTILIRDITEIKRTERLEHEQRILLEALQRIGATVSATLDYDQVLNLVLEQLGQLLSYDSASILIIKGEEMELSASSGPEDPKKLIGLRWQIKGSTHEIVLTLGHSVIYPDVQPFSENYRQPPHNRIHGLLIVPLIVRERIIGFLNLDSEKPNHFTPRDQAIAEAFATPTSIAIENARLFTETQRYARQSMALHQVGLAINSTLDREQILKIILDQIGHVLPSDSAGILMLESDQLLVVAGRDIRQPEKIIGSRLDLASSPCLQIMKENRPVIIPDLQTEYPVFKREPLNYIRSWMGIPLFFKEQIIGFLTLDSCTLNYFKQEDHRTAATFATQVAIALENSRLYGEAQRRITEQIILNEIIQSVASKLSLPEQLNLIFQKINRLISLQLLLIASYISETEEWEIVFSQQEPSQELEPRYKTTQGISGYVIQTRAPLFLPDKQAILNFMREKQRASLISSPLALMSVPLIISDKVVGVMTTQNNSQENAYSPNDFNLFINIGSQVAIALENARMFARMEQLATTDPLTGLFNRRHFFVLSNNEVERAVRYNKPIAAIMFDIDHFKLVNDSYGHSVGDVALQVVARICGETLRKLDIFGRYGGEEFVIVLPETGMGNAELVAERLRQTVEAEIIKVGQAEFTLTISLGVATLDTAPFTLDTLLNCADQALYKAKQAGRNQVKLYNNENG
jgi:diguanylate cyclase (GGDEF)-like protein/PAS domain S-box-containing protein